MPTIVHFDIAVDNPERAKKFYEQLFDWKIELLPGPGNYYLIETTTPDGRKSIGGGMTKREHPGQSITNFIGVESINDYLKKVEKSGGRIITPKTPVPGWGFLAICADTENNTFGLWEEDEKH